MRIFVQEPFVENRSSVYAVGDDITCGAFVKLVRESRRLQEVNEGDECLLEGSRQVPLSEPSSGTQQLRTFLYEVEGTIPNQLHLTGCSARGLLTDPDITLLGISPTPLSGAVDVSPAIPSISIHFPPTTMVPSSSTPPCMEVTSLCRIIVKGQALWEPTTCRLSFHPQDLLDPGARHTVFVRYYDQEGHKREYTWSFITTKLSPLRLTIQEDDNSTTKPARLVLLQRRTRCLVAELKMQIAAKLKESHWDRVLVVQIGPHSLRDHATTTRDHDAILCGLVNDGALVRYRLLPPDTPLPPTPPEPALMANEEYRRQHWVNSESGYLCIGGKLSPQEEAYLLASLVAAYDPQSLEEAGAKEPPPIESAMPQELPPPISPHAAIMKPWEDHGRRVFHVSDLAKEMAVIEELKVRGYVLLKLGDELDGQIQALFDHMQAFFNLNETEKARCVNPNYRYLGYLNKPVYHKESFQVRRAAPQHLFGIWSQKVPQFKVYADQVYTAMATLCESLILHICDYVGIKDTSTLMESPVNAPRSGFSMTNMTLFHYKSHGSAHSHIQVPCPTHTDIGLLTIIPMGRGAPALHLYDRAVQQWADLETSAPRDGAVIFAGETLSRLTNGLFYPAFHEVVPVCESRLSAPFQYLASADASLHYSNLDPSVVGTAMDQWQRPVTGAEFVYGLSSIRASTNYNEI